MNSHVESEKGSGVALRDGLREGGGQDGVDEAEGAGHREEEKNEVENLVDLTLKNGVLTKLLNGQCLWLSW